MGTKEYSYIEWLSAEEMHSQYRNWFSELVFIKDEELFLNNLIKSFTLQILDSENYEKSKELVSSLLDMEKRIVPLFKKIQLHGNQLQIMIDDIDQLDLEKAYRDEHRSLLHDFKQYTMEYRILKKKLFKLVSGFIKDQKQRTLLK
ncbi:hypothetical protein GGR42_002649 [Saonia flava]|uniref:Uncharacterized protein n=1 Tax=Saonia flava TaxID=523696 RepID=A0A846QVY9_9FLAO|nr:hypothetical protein [Saonia flava]NJB72158.1 hypothetical protein [Saonia flava]